MTPCGVGAAAPLTWLTSGCTSTRPAGERPPELVQDTTCTGMAVRTCASICRTAKLIRLNSEPPSSRPAKPLYPALDCDNAWNPCAKNLHKPRPARNHRGQTVAQAVDIPHAACRREIAFQLHPTGKVHCRREQCAEPYAEAIICRIADQPIVGRDFGDINPEIATGRPDRERAGVPRPLELPSHRAIFGLRPRRAGEIRIDRLARHAVVFKLDAHRSGDGLHDIRIAHGAGKA